MQIREGAYYRTRGGDDKPSAVVGPMQYSSTSKCWYVPGWSWTASGARYYGVEGDMDLISEVYVSDTPPGLTATTITNGLPHAMPEAKTLRDEFAMEALPVAYDYIKGDCRTLSNLNLHVIAATAYIFADSMMEARKK